MDSLPAQAVLVVVPLRGNEESGWKKKEKEYLKKWEGTVYKFTVF